MAPLFRPFNAPYVPFLDFQKYKKAQKDALNGRNWGPLFFKKHPPPKATTKITLKQHKFCRLGPLMRLFGLFENLKRTISDFKRPKSGGHYFSKNIRHEKLQVWSET